MNRLRWTLAGLIALPLAAGCGSGSSRFQPQLTAPLAAVTSQLPAGRTGVAYLHTLAGQGGTPPYRWQISAGALPTGLQLQGDRLQGTPAAAGSYSFTVELRDDDNAAVHQALAVSITGPLAIVTSSLSTAYLQRSYSETLTAQGGAPPYRWSVVTGTPPAGLDLSASGDLRGSPTGTGSFPFDVELADANGQTARRGFTVAVQNPQGAPWKTVGDLVEPRAAHAACLLPSGKVLVTGGFVQLSGARRGTATDSVEVFDPATGVFSRAPYAMNRPRALHEAVLLPTGKVLITGGESSGTPMPELYDPATQRFTLLNQVTGIAVATPPEQRAGGRTAVLPGQNEFVVVTVGGVDRQNRYVRLGETLRVITGQPREWKRLDFAATINQHDHEGATVLAAPHPERGHRFDGLLVVGGIGGLGPHARLTSPNLKVRQWDLFGYPALRADHPTAPERVHHTATLLEPSAGVRELVIVGGRPLVGGGGALREAFLFDFTSSRFRDPWGTPVAARVEHTASVLPDDRVLLVGGFDDATPPRPQFTAEVFAHSDESFAAASPLLDARVWHQATVLRSGDVLITGGSSSGSAGTPLRSSAVFEVAQLGAPPPPRAPRTRIPPGPGPNPPGTWSTGPTLGTARAGAGIVTLSNGEVLVAGGYTDTQQGTRTQFPTGTATRSAEILNTNGTQFTATGDMTFARVFPQVVAIPGGGAFVSGGIVNPAPSPEPQPEVYDPSTQSFVLITDFFANNNRTAPYTNEANGPDVSSAPPLKGHHGASVFLARRGSDWRVMIFGGRDLNGSYRDAAEQFDSQPDLWRWDDPDRVKTDGAEARLWVNDSIVLFGGREGIPSEPTRLFVYGGGSSDDPINPLNPDWNTVGALERRFHTVDMLPTSWKYLIVGGLPTDPALGIGGLREGVLYDGRVGAVPRWERLEPARPRWGHTSASLPGNRLVLIGGFDHEGRPQAHAELFTENATNGTFSFLSSMTTPRAWHGTAALASGQIIAVGGVTGQGPFHANGASLATTELLTPP